MYHFDHHLEEKDREWYKDIKLHWNTQGRTRCMKGRMFWQIVAHNEQLQLAKHSIFSLEIVTNSADDDTHAQSDELKKKTRKVDQWHWAELNCAVVAFQYHHLCYHSYRRVCGSTYTLTHPFIHSCIHSFVVGHFRHFNFICYYLLLFTSSWFLPFSQLVSVFGLLHRNINNKLRKKRIFPLFEHEIGSYGKKSR